MSKKMMDIGDPSGHRIIDGDQRQLGLAAFDGGKGVFEGTAGQGFHFRMHKAAGEIGIGAGLALKGDACFRFTLTRIVTASLSTVPE